MLGKLSSAFSSLGSSRAPSPPPATHYSESRAKAYAQLGSDLENAGVPVSHADCAACDEPCQDSTETSGHVLETGKPWDGKPYSEYVEEKYGELPAWSDAIETDWDTDLAGSAQGGRGRVVVVSTGKSDWERDHYDDKSILSHHLNNCISAKTAPKAPEVTSPLAYISDRLDNLLPSIYSSSLISQSNDPDDQTVLVFPDWKVVHEVENSMPGAEELWQGALDWSAGRAGKKSTNLDDVGRRRSWTMPYRAIVLLCSHKRRDKRCHIAAPLLRAAFHTVLEKHDIGIDETGSSLACLDGEALEDLEGTDAERDMEAQRRLSEIEAVGGGSGGEVGIFDINHLGGHRYAGVMLILFPSGAYISYGRVTPQEVPRIVEETIIEGKIVPGLLRNASGVVRPKGDGAKGRGILAW